MALDKMVRTKWYGQNGMDKSSINPTHIDNMIFFINPASNLTPLASLPLSFVQLKRYLIFAGLDLSKCGRNLNCLQNEASHGSMVTD